MLGELRGQLLLTERKRDEWAEVSRQLQLQVTELQEQRVQLNLEVTRQQVGGQLKEQRIAELEAELGRSPATSPKVVRDAEQDGYRRGREEGEAVRSGALNQAAGRGYKQGQDELLLVIAGWLDLPVGGAPEELRSEVEQAISLLKGGSCGRCEMREAELQLLLGLPPTAPWQNLVNRIRAHLLAAKEVAQPAKPTTACPARTDEPITPAEIDLALGRALKVDSDWWGPLRKTGADDAKLREHIARLFGISVSNFGPDQVGTLAKGERVPKAPIIYFSRSERINEKTSLSLHGPALIAAARRLLQIPEHAPPASSQACTEAELLESCLQYNRFAKLLRGVSDEDLLAALRARILDGSGGPGGSGQIGQYGPRGAIRCKLGRKPKQEPVVRFAASSAVFDYDGREVQGAELAAMLRAVFLPTSTAPPCTGCGQPLAPNRMCPQRPLSVCSATDPLTEAARKLGTKHGRERLRPWASKGEELRKLTTTLGAESKTAEEQAELHAVYKAAFDKSNRR